MNPPVFPTCSDWKKSLPASLMTIFGIVWIGVLLIKAWKVWRAESLICVSMLECFCIHLSCCFLILSCPYSRKHRSQLEPPLFFKQQIGQLRYHWFGLAPQSWGSPCWWHSSSSEPWLRTNCFWSAPPQLRKYMWRRVILVNWGVRSFQLGPTGTDDLNSWYLIVLFMFIYPCFTNLSQKQVKHRQNSRRDTKEIYHYFYLYKSKASSKIDPAPRLTDRQGTYCSDARRTSPFLVFACFCQIFLKGYTETCCIKL